MRLFKVPVYIAEVYWSLTFSHSVFSQLAQARSSAPFVVTACRTAGVVFVSLLWSERWFYLLDVDMKGSCRVNEAPNSCLLRPCMALTGGCQDELLRCVLGFEYCVRCDYNGCFEGCVPGIAGDQWAMPRLVPTWLSVLQRTVVFAVADVELLALGAKVDSVAIALQRGRRTAAAAVGT